MSLFQRQWWGKFPLSLTELLSTPYQPSLNTNFGCKSYTDAKIPKTCVFSFVKNVLLREISNMYLSGEILRWAPKPYLLKGKKTKHLEMLRGQWWQAPGVPTEDPTQRQSSKRAPCMACPGFPMAHSGLLRVDGGALRESSLETPETNKATRVFKGLSLSQVLAHRSVPKHSRVNGNTHDWDRKGINRTRQKS